MFDVQLYIYDLSNGLAAQISQQLTGRFFKAIYHTSITIHGREYFFGGSGVESSLPSQSPYGTPIEKRLEGQTEMDPDAWHAFLEECGEDYGVGKYHLLEHNCNTFSDAALQFLLGKRIDPEISSLPSDFLNTSLGRMLRPQIDTMYAPRPGAVLATQTASTKTEVVINGPTSGTHQDRLSEAYKFINTPTVSKLFGKLKSQKDDAKLPQFEAFTTRLVSGGQMTFEHYSDLNRYLVGYMTTIEASEVFPGLDLIRILLHHEPFVTYQCAHQELLAAILAKRYAETSETSKSRVVLLKLVCNALLSPSLRTPMVSLLRTHDALEFISNAPLSEDAEVRQHGLSCIWNLLILADGIDDDFQVACLASVAENKGEEEALRGRILREIMDGGSEAIQEMVEILEL